MRKITRRHSRSPKYTELGNFMLLFCRGPTGKKCTKIYNARAQPLFCSLNFLFGGFLVAVAVMVSTWPFQCTRPDPSFKLKYDRNKVLTNLDDSKWFIVTTDHESANGFRDTTETTRRVKILFFEDKFYRRDTCVQYLKPKTARLCCLSDATGKF